jgi:LDH2 family malate/lactate/ureidoglycolate dehydrogenase
MNLPPKSGIRVPAQELRALVITLFERAGTSREHAEIMARLMVQTDLRGVFSHGSRYTASYVRMILEGRVNPRPDIRVVSETTTAQVIDGDGGMGHWPCYQGTLWAIARAKEHGTAAVTTRNHFHFGGASKYTRMALEQDCIGLAVSRHRTELDPDQSVLTAGGGGPLSFAVPAGEQPPLVADQGMSLLPRDDALFEQYPWAYFKALGLGAIPRVLGGVLAGIYKSEFVPPQSKWESNQGAFITVFNVASFIPVDELKSEMDRFISQAGRMQPAPGYERAELPGGPEWQREKDYARNGIPIGPEHQKTLEEIAAEMEVETPFARYEHSRFGSEP